MYGISKVVKFVETQEIVLEFQEKDDLVNTVICCSFPFLGCHIDKHVCTVA